MHVQNWNTCINLLLKHDMKTSVWPAMEMYSYIYMGTLPKPYWLVCLLSWDIGMCTITIRSGHQMVWKICLISDWSVHLWRIPGMLAPNLTVPAELEKEPGWAVSACAGGICRSPSLLTSYSQYDLTEYTARFVFSEPTCKDEEWPACTRESGPKWMVRGQRGAVTSAEHGQAENTVTELPISTIGDGLN